MIRASKTSFSDGTVRLISGRKIATIEHDDSDAFLVCLSDRASEDEAVTHIEESFLRAVQIVEVFLQ